jgi:hypothetical protein
MRVVHYAIVPADGTISAMRRGRQLGCALAMATTSACALFTDLGDFSSGGDQAADAAAADGAAPGADGSRPNGDDGGAVADAASEDSSSVEIGTVFADSFDDAAPLPRGWDEVTGPPTIGPSTDAPSKPNVLVAGSKMPHGEVKLLKRVATPGKSVISCRFRVKVTKNTLTERTTVAVLEAADGVYAWFEVANAHWHYYGQQGTTEYSNQLVTSTAGQWLDTTITIEKVGKITVTSLGGSRTSTIAPVDTSKLLFAAGIVRLPNTNEEREVLVDDVVCTAK